MVTILLPSERPRFFMIASLLLMFGANANPVTDAPVKWDPIVEPAPTVKPNPHVSPATSRLEAPQIELMAAAEMRYGRKYDLVLVNVDATNPGKDGWRTCGRMTIEQFGILPEVPAVLLNKQNEPCGDHPNDPLALVMVVGPTGFHEAIMLPSKGSEYTKVELAIIQLD